MFGVKKIGQHASAAEERTCEIRKRRSRGGSVQFLSAHPNTCAGSVGAWIPPWHEGISLVFFRIRAAVSPGGPDSW